MSTNLGLVRSALRIVSAHGLGAARRMSHNLAMRPASPAPRPQRRPPAAARWLGVLMCVVISGLGLVSILAQHHHGRNTRFGTELWLEGAAAVRMGWGLVLLGLMPLALCARSARAAAWWAGLTMAAGVLLMLSSARVA